MDTTRGYVADLRIFCLYMRNPEIEAVEVADVIGFMEGMLALGWEKNSLMRKAIALRGLFGFCRKMQYRVIDPELIPVPDHECKPPRVASADHVAKVIEAIPKTSKDPRHVRNRAMILMYRDTGCRLNELTALDIDDYVPGQMKAVVRTEKSRGKRPYREILWGDEAEASLMAWAKRREALSERKAFACPEALFISIGNARHGERFTGKGVGTMLRNYSDRAGVPWLNAHSLRHKRMHDIVKAGGSAADVMNIAGHSSLASSTVYTMMFGDELEGRYRELLGH